MRKTALNTVIFCDVDLSQLTSSRISVTALGDDRYEITSPLKLHKSETASFVKRLIWRNMGKPKLVRGNASCPEGYLYNR